MNKSLLLLVLLLFASCNDSRSYRIHDDEIKRSAWFIEDCCHDIKRRPGELVRANSSVGQLQIAHWMALGDLSREQDRYPLHIEKRRQHWLIIKQGLRGQQIRSRDNGFIALSQEISTADRQIFADSVSQENLFRANTDRLVLQQAGLEARSARGQQLLQALVQARVALDRQVLVHESANK